MRPQVKFAKLQEFHRLLKETSRRQGFWAPNFNQLKAKTKAFGKNAILFLAYPPSSRQRRASEGQALPSQPNNQITESPNHPIAGALILLHDGIAYYHHAATSIAGRKLDATYLLMWEIIKFLVTHSPSNPVTQLDLGGIYDHRYHKATKKWQNFSIFKQKWGGQEVEYPIPLIKYYHPVVKLVFKLGSLFN